jgi:hypothetical protein
VPPNRVELRPKLRPTKITGYRTHDFEVVPQTKTSLRPVRDLRSEGMAPDGAALEPSARHSGLRWRRGLCVAGRASGTGRLRRFSKRSGRVSPAERRQSPASSHGRRDHCLSVPWRGRTDHVPTTLSQVSACPPFTLRCPFPKQALAVTSPPLCKADLPGSVGAPGVVITIFGVRLSPMKSSRLQRSADHTRTSSAGADGSAARSRTSQRTFCGLLPDDVMTGPPHP